MTDANMNNGAGRFGRRLFYIIAGTMIALPAVAQDITPDGMVDQYRSAYLSGRDPLTERLSGIDITSLEARLELTTVQPVAALTGNAFLSSSGNIIQLAGTQGCLSTSAVAFNAVTAPCTAISLAGFTAVIDEAKSGAGDAFPCHFFSSSSSREPVQPAECFYVRNGEVLSLSDTLIRRGLGFAARDRSGRPIFAEFAAAEDAARQARAGIWANVTFIHPYGERYRASRAAN